MARQPRIVVPNVVHHVVARGVNRTRIFRSGYDKGRYLKRVAVIAEEEQVRVHGYCLMGNHVHFLLTPTTPLGLAQFFLRLHTWWAGFFNAKNKRSGHLFQGRYFSSPLSECHYWTALRYVELNSVRAKLVSKPEDWPWSSAGIHLQVKHRSIIPLVPVPTRAQNNASEWRQILETDHDEGFEQLRRAQRCSNPCGPPSFIQELRLRFRHRQFASG